MVTVVKNYNSPPARLLSMHCLSKALDCMGNPSTHSHDKYYYRDGCFEELNDIYSYKCAYCETSVSAGADLRVDHYRPKKKVDNLPTHQGYYWLTYEWSNLILACERCNGKKSNKFPIQDEKDRIYSPILEESGHCREDYKMANSAIYTSENPVILNPEIDDVESQLFFTPNGEIVGITAKANATILILELNRKSLLIERKKIIDRCLNQIHACIDDYIISGNYSHVSLSLKRVFDELVTLQDRRNAYSRLGWFMFNKFEVFLVSKLLPKEALIVKKAFDKYLKGTL